MKLPTYSIALVAIALGTSAWADDAALSPANFLDSHEETFVAQFLPSDMMEVTDSAPTTAEQAKADAIAAIVDSIARDTVLIGNSVAILASEGLSVASSTAESDPAEVTGSILSADIVLDGFEDR